MTKERIKLSGLQWVAVIFSVVFVLVLGTVSVWSYGIFYRQWDSSLVRKISNAVHFPAARLGSRLIPYTEYLTHLDAERRFLNGSRAQAMGFSPTLTTDMKSQTLDRVIRIEAVQEAADTAHFEVTSQDVNNAYNDLVARAGTSTTPTEIQTFLMDQFGWDVDQFKQNVVRPALLEDGLKKKLADAGNTDENAFETQLQERLAKSDVVRYLKF